MQPKAIAELTNMYYSRCRAALSFNDCELLFILTHDGRLTMPTLS